MSQQRKIPENVNARGAMLSDRASLTVLPTNDSGNGPIGDKAVAHPGRSRGRCKQTFTHRVISAECLHRKTAILDLRGIRYTFAYFSLHSSRNMVVAIN